MAIKLYGHPFSSYCWKVLIALYENEIEFEWRLLADDPAVAAEHAALWPLKKMPVLVDGDRVVLESTIIIDYLDLHHPGPHRLMPGDRDAALVARSLDRYFDNYVMTPMQKIVGDYIREESTRDPHGVAQARALLDEAYGWLDGVLPTDGWAVAGKGFTLADCAGAPSLFYADWVQPIATTHSKLRAYRQRLLARPSVARVVDEARPYRKFFPPGAPDRD